MLNTENMLLRLLTPTNLDEEKEKFFASRRYMPIFKYNWKIDAVNKVRSRYQDLMWACMRQDEWSIVREGKRVFKIELDQNILTEAKRVVESMRIHRLNGPAVDRVIEEFGKVFTFFDLDWKIQIEGSGFNFRPRSARRILQMGRDISWEFFSLEGEVRHELIHIIRYENGVFNKIEKDEGYLPTEEGLACYMHDFKGLEENYSLFQHAAEYLATEVALGGNLRDVVDFFRSLGFSKELAWQRGVRHKFGFVDTSVFGDIMKPAMYFYHELKIKALSDEEKLRLMVGKVDVDNLKMFRSYQGKISEERLRGFYGLER